MIITLYGIAFYNTTQWFMSLSDPTNAQAGFVSVIVGAGAGFFGIYVNGKPTEHKVEQSRPTNDRNADDR